MSFNFFIIFRQIYLERVNNVVYHTKQGWHNFDMCLNIFITGLSLPFDRSHKYIYMILSSPSALGGSVTITVTTNVRGTSPHNITYTLWNLLIAFNR